MHVHVLGRLWVLNHDGSASREQGAQDCVHRRSKHLHPSPVNAAAAAVRGSGTLSDVPMNPGWFIMWSQSWSPDARRKAILIFLFLYFCVFLTSSHLRLMLHFWLEMLFYRWWTCWCDWSALVYHLLHHLQWQRVNAEMMFLKRSSGSPANF